MDRITDSESCTDCGHDHYPYGFSTTPYLSRKDKCCEPGCDCETYSKPENPKVYKCSRCQRMVTRVISSCWGGGHRCDSC